MNAGKLDKHRIPLLGASETSASLLLFVGGQVVKISFFLFFFFFFFGVDWNEKSSSTVICIEEAGWCYILCPIEVKSTFGESAMCIRQIKVNQAFGVNLSLFNPV